VFLDRRMKEGRVKQFMAFRLKQGLITLAFASLACTSVAMGQNAQPMPGEDSGTVSGGTTASDPQSPGTISGMVVDQSGAVVAGARVKLRGKDHAQGEEAVSGTDGQFFFPNIPPGAFELTITSTGFAPKTLSGTLRAGEVQTLPQIALIVADMLTEVRVGVTPAEVAQEQMKIEEKQRVLGVIPNFYVSYIPNAAPLNTKQKFHLALRTLVDPFTFVIVGGTAGIEQAQNHFAEYGQGAAGYGKRFGANYADTVSGTLIGAAILPSILKQDPRYFYKGTGSKVSRFGYAIANALICKGDNGHWQPNYSNIGGAIAAGGISNLYYPDQDKSDAGLTFENAGIGIASTAVANLFQEFLIRHLTPKLNNRGTGGD
jgi:Carboxypeptidase regulatory-like domain